MIKRILFVGFIVILFCTCGSKPKTNENLIEEDHLVWFEGKEKSPINPENDYTEKQMDPTILSANHDHWGDFIGTEVVEKKRCIMVNGGT